MAGVVRQAERYTQRRSSKSGRTYWPRRDDIDDQWYVIDCAGLIPGRVCVEVALRVRGKRRPEFAPNADMRVFVVLVNVDRFDLGRRERLVTSHSGYPGGLKQRTFEDELRRDPVRAVRRQVKGMLPRNRLSGRLLRRVFVYNGPTHPHAAQAPAPLDLAHARRDRRTASRLGRSHEPALVLEGVATFSRIVRTFRSFEGEEVNMALIPLDDEGLEGVRVELSGRAASILNVYADDDALTVSWGTDLSPTDAFALLAKAARDALENEEYALGVLRHGRLDVRQGARLIPTRVSGEISALLDGDTEPDICRLDTTNASWVWQRASVRRDGSSTTTFGVVADRIDAAIVLRVFDATARQDLATWRPRLEASLA